jgi:exodeoxyribonuclease VIII
MKSEQGKGLSSMYEAIPRHAMIDLETMALTPDCAIVSIGAVIFDPRYGIVTDDTFYVELKWREQNRTISKSTRAWWKTQAPHIQAATMRGDTSLQGALSDLEFWLPDDVKVWGNGATFDISILEDAYRQCKHDIPWKFWNIRDMRTVKDMYESKRGGLDRRSGGGEHNALNDAIWQAECTCKMWRELLKEE